MKTSTGIQDAIIFINNHQWMKRILVVMVIILVIAGGFFGYIQLQIYQIQHALSDCTVSRTGFYCEVPFEFRKLVIVKVRLNNSEKWYDFILDTGAPTIISDSTLKEIVQKKTQVKELNIKDKKVALKESIIKLENLQIGDVNFKDVGALVMDASKMGMLNCLGFDGIIGYNILKTAIFQINFKENKIVISDQPVKMNFINGAIQLNYTTTIQETPLINVTLNDTLTLDLTLDTGHNGSLTIGDSSLVNFYQRHFPDQIAKRFTRPSITIRGQDKNIKAISEDYLCLLRSIRIGNMHFNTSLVTVRKENNQRKDGLIGAAFLRNFILTLNYEEKTVYLYPLNQSYFSGNKQTFGIEVTPFGNQVIIGSVYEGSLAEKQGLEIGDQVIWVDSLSLTSLPPETLCGFFLGESALLDTEKDSIRIKYQQKGSSHSITLHKYNLFN